jgi:hypothetical protein
MATPKTAPTPGIEYLSLDAMTPFEREVFDLALAALSLPLTERQLWFRRVAEHAKLAHEIKDFGRV